MNDMTEEEFRDRTQAIIRARKIFVASGVTKNIGVAFELYQAVCAERERELFISTQGLGNTIKTVMDKFERPLCPDCNAEMRFRQVQENPDGIKLQLVCTVCDTVLNSEQDLQWWMDNLRENK
jgi:hypothetical protein